MDNILIKNAVNKVNFIKSTEDKNFTTIECRDVASDLFVDLVGNFKQAPTTAIALVQYLVDEDFDIAKLEKETYENYIKTFGYKLSQFTNVQIDQVRQISRKLML